MNYKTKFESVYLFYVKERCQVHKLLRSRREKSFRLVFRDFLFAGRTTTRLIEQERKKESKQENEKGRLKMLKKGNEKVAGELLRERCGLRRGGKIVETSVEILERCARSVAESSSDYEDFIGILSEGEFLPNSPMLANAGTGRNLSACYVLPIEDSIESIYRTLSYQARIFQSGGGVGIDFSSLRPEGAEVKSTGGKASGPVSFMKLFSVSTEVVRQGGIRRGANMGVLSSSHEDVEKFVGAKRNVGNGLENFNLSVGFTDDDFENKPELVRLCAERAWESGEPGVLFLDEINRKDPTPWLGRITSTNPCGETPLRPFEACTLGSVDLSKFYKKEINGKFSMKNLDEERLRFVVSRAVRFLDRSIDVNRFPLPETETAVKRTRKLGLGVMGFADLLFALRVPYDSEEAVEIAETIMSHFNSYARSESERLGKIKGNYERGDSRNATVTCIAPTGTLSLLAGCSGGIEPVFSLSMNRYVETSEGKKKISALNARFDADRQTLSQNELKRIYRTAGEIGGEWHVAIAAAFQKNTDLAVSKTVNLPNNATISDVEKIFRLAKKSNCKGITVFRDGCLSTGQVFNNAEKCPVCGFPTIRTEGCVKCSVCIWGACSM